MNSGVSVERMTSDYTDVDSLTLQQWGCTLIVAAHPDDESLACSGTIASLRKLGNRVDVLFITDGSMSHPNSKTFPSESIKKLRESEALEALSVVDVQAGNVFFCRFKDGCSPMPDSEDFQDAVDRITLLLSALSPDTIVLPWKRDPHPDHRSAYHLLSAVLQKTNRVISVLEYPLWLLERGERGDMPRDGEISTYRVNIADFLPLKRRAIAAHRSQVSDLIDDDPFGFRLSPNMISHFTVPFEFFFQERLSH